MLDLLRRFIGQPAAAPAPPAPTMAPPQPARAPVYDSRLVEALKHDHQELIHLFEQIGRLIDAKRFDLIPSQLVAFKTRLEAHLLTENVRFYNYVEHSLQEDPEDLALIRDFRREMNSIARAVVEFVKKYQRLGVDQTMQVAFVMDYRAVGGLLVQRIEREEGNLYPLYQPG